MGAVSFSLDTRLLQLFTGLLPLTTFVETGTFEGASIRQAIPFFKQLYSVELSPKYFKSAQQEFADLPSVQLHCGPSAAFLAELRTRLQLEATLYWLDAHWCHHELSAEESQCPLLDELAAIGRLNSQSVVLIDDARLFLAPPPKPLIPKQWPRLVEIVRALEMMSEQHRMVVVDDVIVFYPAAVEVEVERYAQECAVDLLQIMATVRAHQTTCEQVLAERNEKERVIQELVRELDRSRTASHGN